MRNLRRRRALVTGAASGLGRALALELAHAGCDLALSDVDAARLELTRAEVVATGSQVHTAVLDVADRCAVYAYAERLTAEIGPVHLLVNNAGVLLTAAIEEMEDQDLEWVLGVNFWGVVYGTKAFLPYLRVLEEAHIVNISSVFGLVGMPTQGAYCCTKFAVRGFTETLEMELAAATPHVRVSLVIPGGIKTGIARSARCPAGSWIDEPEDWRRQFEKTALTTPQAAARATVRGIQRNSPRILIGNDAHVADFVHRLLPDLYRAGVLAICRRSRAGRTMDREWKIP